MGDRFRLMNCLVYEYFREGFLYSDPSDIIFLNLSVTSLINNEIFLQKGMLNLYVTQLEETYNEYKINYESYVFFYMQCSYSFSNAYKRAKYHNLMNDL